MKRSYDCTAPSSMRALIHPLWGAALILLVLNDHWFKTAALLTGLLTGKISDFAGLFVAPMALAALLRVTSSRSLAGCHVFIGMVFALINLMPWAARAMEWLTAWTPFPWVIVVDPTDLMALPMLWLSWRVFTPLLKAPLTARPFPLVEKLALAFGLWACAATAPIEPPPPPPVERPTMWGNIGIANLSAFPATLRVRRLKETVYLDCELAAADPTGVFSRDLFGPAEIWVLDGSRAIALSSWNWDTSCDAFLVDGGGLPMRLIFFDLQAYPENSFASDMEALLQEETIATIPSQGVWYPHPTLFAAPPVVESLPEKECQIPDEMVSLAWSELPDQGYWVLKEISMAPDGCHRLELESEDSGKDKTFFVCMPADAFPFEVDESVYFKAITLGQELGVVEGVELYTATKRLRLARGADTVNFGLSGSMDIKPKEECTLVHDECGNLVRPMVLDIDDTTLNGLTTLEAGQTLTFGDGEETLYLVRALDIPMGDWGCVPEGTTETRLIETVYTSLEE